MAPNRFRRDVREKRESTPFAEDPNAVTSIYQNHIPLNTAPPEIPAEWRDIEAPINFTWVCQDELAGMGWPKSRDQVRFLVQQGIDHLVTLSSDKLPPHYAFPDLKWTSIPVEDFTGPTIAEIKKFIGIMDDARKEGEAVGVHCAEGRGRTGVMCACYLIYYHDISPWDAIRIMRRQRPGSVERKVQEETVVTFGKLLQDYGKSTLEQLEQKEKELKELQKKQQEHNENILLLHTATFYQPVASQRNEQKERMHRSRSMPKINQEEEILEEAAKEEINFRKHMQNFFKDNVGRCRSQPRDREKTKDGKEKDNSEEEEDESQLRTRAITPGRQLLLNLKPVGTTRPKKAKVHKQSKLASEPEDTKNEYNKHFKTFMSTTSSVKRVRSFSQTRDKESEEMYKSCKTSDTMTNTPPNSVKVTRKYPLRKPSFEKKCVEDRAEKENKSKELKEDNSITVHHLRKEKAPSPSASECSMTSSLSSMSKDYNGTSDKPILEQDNKEAEQNMVRRTSSDSTKDLPPPPSSKPKCSVDESSSSNYSYYVRIRSRASSKHDTVDGAIKNSNDEAVSLEEKHDHAKEDSEIQGSTSTPKAKPKTRSRATTKKSETNSSTNSNDKTISTKSKQKSTSQSKLPVGTDASATPKTGTKKTRSKTVDKDTTPKDVSAKNDLNSNDTSQEPVAVDITSKPVNKVSSTPPKTPPICKFKAADSIKDDPYWKMIYSDEPDVTPKADTKPPMIPHDMSSEKSEKSMLSARTSLLQPKVSNRRRSSNSNSSPKGCNAEYSSDSNNNDTTPRPSPCKYTGSLSNTSIPSSPNCSTTSIVCSPTAKENENNLKNSRRRVNRIYDRSDSNSSYKSNGHCSTLTGNDAENPLNESSNKERKRSLSKGVEKDICTSECTTDSNTTAVNSSTSTSSTVIEINNSNNNTNSNDTSSSSPTNTTAMSFHEKDTAKSERRHREKMTYRRSTTGPIVDLNLLDTIDNDKSKENCHRVETDIKKYTMSTPSSVTSSSTNISNINKNDPVQNEREKYKPKPKMAGGTLHYSTYRMSYGMRAKSECNLTDYDDNSINDNEQYRSTEDNTRNNTSSAISSRESNTYGLSQISSSRENQFLSAAKKWASYDKTPYISPFARDSWKRTNRKFNYSRFLNYTRETFV